MLVDMTEFHFSLKYITLTHIHANIDYIFAKYIVGKLDVSQLKQELLQHMSMDTIVEALLTCDCKEPRTVRLRLQGK